MAEHNLQISRDSLEELEGSQAFREYLQVLQEYLSGCQCQLETEEDHLKLRFLQGQERAYNKALGFVPEQLANTEVNS